MATYEFRCRACGTTFEERRPMAAAHAPATCPAGHRDTTRLLSVFTPVGGGRAPAPSTGASAPGTGCCGGGCRCG